MPEREYLPDGLYEVVPETRERWLAGLCLCCGGEMGSWDHPYLDEHYEPSMIAEGVMLCGRCTGCQHLENPRLRAACLAALVP